jgi:hypothetical protein
VTVGLGGKASVYGTYAVVVSQVGNAVVAVRPCGDTVSLRTYAVSRRGYTVSRRGYPAVSVSASVSVRHGRYGCL